MSKQANGVINDAQLRAVNAITDPQPLLEVMLKHFNLTERCLGDPFMLRVILAGSKNEDAPSPIGSVIPELLNNPGVRDEDLCCTLNDGPIEPSGLLIDYEGHFILLIEGYEMQIMHFLKLLKKHGELKKDSSYLDVQVLYLIDDVVLPVAPVFAYIDKVPAVSAGGETRERSDEEISDMITKDIRNMMELSKLVSNETSDKRKSFMDSARVTHFLLFPSVASIKTYLGSNLFLTLSEYLDLFGKIPELTRDMEIDHPVEDPLTY